nr:BatA domain-containing protein [Planctomycetota bacterium]
MIELINLWALGGLAAAAAPVVVHIAHRRKYVSLDWGAMRFLVDLIAKRRRRLLIDQLLLLAVRVTALALTALALCRPAFDPGGENGHLARRGAVAAVLLIDDSLSTNAGRAEPVFAEEKRLAGAYLETLRTGDEVSVLTLSRLGANAAEPVYDLEAAKAAVAALQPGSVASDMPALFEAGLAQLARHLNPACELVLVGDGRRDGWLGVDPLRWGELR